MLLMYVSNGDDGDGDDDGDDECLVKGGLEGLGSGIEWGSGNDEW
jgi:hypothetical protein